MTHPGSSQEVVVVDDYHKIHSCLEVEVVLEQSHQILVQEVAILVVVLEMGYGCNCLVRRYFVGCCAKSSGCYLMKRS